MNEWIQLFENLGIVVLSIGKWMVTPPAAFITIPAAIIGGLKLIFKKR